MENTDPIPKQNKHLLMETLFLDTKKKKKVLEFPLRLSGNEPDSHP